RHPTVCSWIWAARERTLLVYIDFFSKNEHIVELFPKPLHKVLRFASTSEVTDFHPVIRLLVAQVGIDTFIQPFETGLFSISFRAVRSRIDLNTEPHHRGTRSGFLIYRWPSRRGSCYIGALSAPLHQ